MTLPDKPTSSLQRYRTTAAGEKYLADRGDNCTRCQKINDRLSDGHLAPKPDAELATTNVQPEALLFRREGATMLASLVSA